MISALFSIQCFDDDGSVTAWASGPKRIPLIPTSSLQEQVKEDEDARKKQLTWKKAVRWK